MGKYTFLVIASIIFLVGKILDIISKKKLEKKAGQKTNEKMVKMDNNINDNSGVS